VVANSIEAGGLRDGLLDMAGRVVQAGFGEEG
jgi:hypothetical protein